MMCEGTGHDLRPECLLMLQQIDKRLDKIEKVLIGNGGNGLSQVVSRHRAYIKVIGWVSGATAIALLSLVVQWIVRSL